MIAARAIHRAAKQPNHVAIGLLHRHIEEGEPTTGTLDGHSTTVFAARTAGSAPVVLEDALGIGADCCGPSGQQIFVDLGSKTILIRTGIYEASATAELEDVLANDELVYVGLTRARAHLVLVGTKTTLESLRTK